MLDRVVRLGVRRRRQHARGDDERQVAAGRRAADPEALRVHAPVVGVVADVADGAVDVGDDLLVLELGHAAVAHGEDRVAAPAQQPQRARQSARGPQGQGSRDRGSTAGKGAHASSSFQLAPRGWI